MLMQDRFSGVICGRTSAWPIVRPGATPGQFACVENGEEMLRIPISYLLKLALAHIIGQPGVPAVAKSTGEQMMDHFLNDNTSPETHSFHPLSPIDGERVGAVVAAETLLRYLPTQLLVQYANRRFELEPSGQKVIVYFGPHPPVRQRMLNDLIPDVLYRELFMSPCLSGWHCGEEKHRLHGAVPRSAV